MNDHIRFSYNTNTKKKFMLKQSSKSNLNE